MDAVLYRCKQQYYAAVLCQCCIDIASSSTVPINQYKQQHTCARCQALTSLPTTLATRRITLKAHSEVRFGSLCKPTFTKWVGWEANK